MVIDMREDEKLNLAQAVIDDPNGIFIEKHITQFDEIAYIEKIVNLSDEELISQGMSKEDINEFRIQIKVLNDTSDEKFRDQYQKSDEQIKLIRMALEPDSNYSEKELSGNVVTSSGSITTSEMNFYVTGYNNAATTGHPISYRLYSYFDWLSMPLLHMRDEICLTWGGGLNSKDIVRDYYDDWGNNFYKTGVDTDYRKTTTFTSSGELSGLTQTINNGIVFWLETCSVNLGEDLAFMDHGYNYVTIYNLSKQTKATKALARYGHRVISFSVSSFSFTSIPSINVGSGYDYTYEDEYNPINY